MGSDDLAQERIGQLIAGRYRLERLLGAGGMGAVYQAMHEFTQRKVAVKLMHPQIARSKLAAERFVREAQAPSSIGHRGIVEVLDGGRADDGSLYLVLELLEGQTLAAALRAGALTPGQLGAIALQLLDALAAAHAAGFVHRDIKPDNVFLVAGGDDGANGPQVKLLDFGVISVIDESSPALTKAGMVLGTPLYMSPEQALGRRVDGRSDLWSLGAVCYQALTGRPPFAGKSAQALIVSISTEEHLPLSVVRPGLPLRMVKVVERALAKQPDKRWQSAEEMADALRIALAGEERTSSPRVSDGDGVAVPAAAVRSQLNDAAEPRAAEGRGSGRGAYRLIGAAVGALTVVAAAGAWALSRPSADARATSLSEEASGSLAAAPKQAPAPDPSPDPDPNPRPGPVPPPGPGPTLDPSPRPDPNPDPNPDPSPNAPAAAGLDSSALSAVLREHDAELQRCYEDAVVAELMKAGSAPAADPAPVRLDAEITIATSGTVEKLTLRGDASDAMRTCAQKAIQAWKFPSATAPTEVRFPMVFQPNIVRQ